MPICLTRAAVLGLAALAVLFHVMPGDLHGLPNLAIHPTMTLCLIALILRENNILSSFLKQRMGPANYGIYLCHLLAMDVIHRILRTGYFPKWVF